MGIGPASCLYEKILVVTRVLFLSYDGLTDPLGQSQIIPYFLDLSRNHDIHIVSFEKKEAFENKRNEISETLKKNGVVWTPLRYHKKPPILSTLWDIYVLTRTVYKLLKTFKPHVIHCRSYITAIVGNRYRQKASFLFDMRGFYADERREGGLWPPGHPIYEPIYRYFKKLEKSFLQNAAHIVSLTHAGKVELVRQYALPPENISVIPCAADLDFFASPRNTRLEVRQRLRVPAETPLVVYAGSLGTWYLPVEMMNFFKVFETLHPGAIFLILNKGEHHIARQAAQKAEVDAAKLRILEATRSEMPHYLQAADIGLFFIKPSYSKKASSPVKMGEMLASGLPVIANAGVGDVDTIIRETGCGHLVENFSNEAFQSAALSWKEKREVWRGKTYKAAEKFFNLKEGVKLYDAIYRKISTSATITA